MAAGIAVYYDKNGAETADLIHNQWPLYPGQTRFVNEYSKVSERIGTRVHCHAGQSYVAPEFPAGTSKRNGDFYVKTGVQQHRLEPGFRDTKGRCTLTETHIPGYGTMRASMRLPSAGTLVLTPSQVQTLRPASVGGASRRSNGSQRSRQSAGGSVRSQRSNASSTPSWVKKTGADQPQEWSFEALPMYQRTSEAYGKMANASVEAGRMRAAGRTDSGFVDPSQLIALLTRKED